MSPRLKSIFNILIFFVLLSLIILIIEAGKGLEIKKAMGHIGGKAAGNYTLESIKETFRHPLPVFLMQLIIIIIASRICGFLFRKVGQPQVMGEIIAGIILGPSVVGGLLPAFSTFIFPAQSLENLQILSQVGLVLFMFVIGMELDLEIIKNTAKAALFISNASIIIPYILGVALSYFLYRRFAPPNIPFYAFALFMGIAMSITAFPVLARIIKEKDLSNTRLGTIALTSAAAGDITGWCILAFVIAIVKAGTIVTSVFTILFAVLYILVMFVVVRPLLQRYLRKTITDGRLRQSSLAVIFMVLLFSAYLSEIIGIHALFGAFLAGIIMPEDLRFRQIIIDKIEDVALVLLLPLFFVFTGLRTEIGLLNDASLWGACLIVIALAIAGKFGGSAIAARIKGETLHDSLAIGALMNTRGLMELIILNIGYDLGILSPQIFAMLVLMALVTTFMTSPLLTLINKIHS